MRAAQYVPPQWAKRFYRSGYNMVIAPWLHDPDYVKVWPFPGVGRANDFLILENELFEKLRPPPVPLELEGFCCLVRPNEVILPDKLGDPTVTHWESKAALGVVGQEYRISVMFVPHAYTFSQWKDVLHDWLNMWERENWNKHYESLTIGVSSLRRGHKEQGSVWPEVGSRIEIMRYLCEYYPELEFHLLGIPTVNEFAMNELPVAIQTGARGVDTPIAFALGAHRELLTPYSKKRFVGDITKYPKSEMTYAQLCLIRLNQKILDYWCERGEGSERIPLALIQETLTEMDPEGFMEPRPPDTLERQGDVRSLLHIFLPRSGYKFTMTHFWPGAGDTQAMQDYTDLFGKEGQ